MPDPGPFSDVESGAEVPNKVSHTPLENKIAFEFDGFCTYLIGFRKLIRDEMLTIEDLNPHLRWWFEVIVGPHEGASPDPTTIAQAAVIRAQLHAYLKDYYPSECVFIAHVLAMKLEDTPFGSHAPGGP